MIFHIFCMLSLIGIVSSCTSPNDCLMGYYVCRNDGQCGACSSDTQCDEQHLERKTCVVTANGNPHCVQCLTNSNCDAGQSCVVDRHTYLCATSCTSPTDTCTSNSQCIFIRTDGGESASVGNFYCLSCENDGDCKLWSNSSTSTCTAGVCSPAFVSCRKDTDCMSLTASDCSHWVCRPCSSNDHCSRFSATPFCDSGTCVQCLTDSDCPSETAAKCSEGTCVACTHSSQCARFSQKTVCNTTYGKCVECNENGECPFVDKADCLDNQNRCSPCKTKGHCAKFPSAKVCKNPGTASALCVQCVVDSNCTSAAAAQCSESNICVPCTESTHCAHLTATPVCKDPLATGTCVQCLAHSDCPSIAAAQCSESNTCAPCTDSTQCERFGSTPLCDTSSGECVRCLIDSDCPSKTAAKCSEGVCVACTDSSQCSRFSATPLCNSTKGKCVECNNNSECPYGDKADCFDSINQCGPCTKQYQCHKFPSAKVCRNPGTASAICVQCVADSNCTSAAASQCSESNTCIPCASSTHCAHLTSKPICKNPGAAGTCVQCLVHSDCPSTAAAQCSGNTCVPCTSNSHCSHLSETQACNTTTGVCVECVHNGHCTFLTKPNCREGDNYPADPNYCQGCTNSANGQCDKFPETPVCKNPGPTTGVCVQCASDSDCPTAAAAQCSEITNTCVPCTANTHCAHLTSTPACKDPGPSGTCVPCVVDADCPNAAAAKCSAGNTCIACTDSNQCSHLTSQPICKTSGPSGVCVQCTSHSHCPTTKANCLAANFCVGCTSTEHHCARFPSTPVCKTPGGTTGVCVQCVTDSDCPNASAAQCSESNTCIPCTANTQCAHLTATSLCKDPGAAGKCVQCVTDWDCPTAAAAKCSESNTCVPCTDSSQCAHLTSKPVCKDPGAGGRCVECVDHSDCPSIFASKCNSNTCITCTGHAHCSHFPATQACNTTVGSCVECNANVHCTTPTKANCRETHNFCTGCTTNNHCTRFPKTPICKNPGLSTGLCVQCVSATDCPSPATEMCVSDICTPKCIPNCLHCLNATACKTCFSGYYLLNATSCLAACPNGYWENSQTQTCDLCDDVCQTCETNANRCTSCFTPYILDAHKCRPPLSNPPPTVSLMSSSDPQTFLLVFSNPMAITPEILAENIQFSLTNMSSLDFTLLNITAKSDSKTFRLTFNFTRSFGIETLTVTFKNKKIIADRIGVIITQDSVSAQTVRFTYFTAGEKAAANTLTSVGSTVSGAALSSSAGMFLAGGAGGMLWAFLGIFQIVSYLLYLNVNYPYNVEAFFQMFSESSITALVPNPIQYVFPDIYEKMQTGLPSPAKFSENGMDALYMNNAGATLAAWIVIGLIYLCTKFILFTFRTSGRVNRVMTNFNEKFEWGIVYDALIGTYPELIIASCLQFVNMNFTTPVNTFSSVAALIVGSCCFWAPFAVTTALESSSEVLGTELHSRKHGVLYENFIVESKDKASPETAFYRRNFMAFIFLRKLTYFSGIVLAYDIPILQMLITCCSGIVLLIFMLKVKPYRQKRDVWMNVGSEVLMVIIHLVIFIFAGDDITQTLTDTQRKNLGWVVIALCSLLVVYNALFIFIQQVIAFWTGLKFLARVLCKKDKSPEVKRRINQESDATNNKITNNVTEYRTPFGISSEKTLIKTTPDEPRIRPAVIPRLRNRRHRANINNLFNY